MVNKVIFLDVDGVLNNDTWVIEMSDKGIHVYKEDFLCQRQETHQKAVMQGLTSVHPFSFSSASMRCAINLLHPPAKPARAGARPHFSFHFVQYDGAVQTA